MRYEAREMITFLGKILNASRVEHEHDWDWEGGKPVLGAGWGGQFRFLALPTMLVPLDISKYQGYVE